MLHKPTKKQVKWIAGIFAIIVMVGATLLAATYNDAPILVGEDQLSFVSSTEYYFGDAGEVAAELMNYRGVWINASCFATAYYPNKSMLFDSQLMAVNPDSKVYYYQFDVPDLPGVYEYRTTCYFGNSSDRIYHVPEWEPPSSFSASRWPTINITSSNRLFVEKFSFYANSGYPPWEFKNVDTNTTISSGTMVFDYNYPLGISNVYAKVVLNTVLEPNVNYQLIVTPNAGGFGGIAHPNGTIENPLGLTVVQNKDNAFDIVGGNREMSRSKSFHVSNGTQAIIDAVNDKGLKAVLAK